MNADPRASLIVPVHDCEPYLPRLLGSIDAQTSRDFEVIFIDDCSTDASAKILAGYAAKTADIGVRALSTAESPAPADGNGPRGPSAARNIGIDAARGEYLMFLDGDDFMEPALVERALGRADETGADIVIWDLWFYNDVLERIQYPYVGTLTFEYFAGKDVFCYRDNPDRIFTSFQNWVWNKMFRADMVRREGLRFDEGLHRTEDAPFTCVALARAERIALMYERLSNYRILASKPSLMGSVSARPLDFVNAFLLLRSQLEERGLFDETRRSFVNWCAGGIVSNLDALSPYGVFLMLYRRLQAGGLDELGLTADLPEGYYFDPESRRRQDDDARGVPRDAPAGVAAHRSAPRRRGPRGDLGPRGRRGARPRARGGARAPRRGAQTEPRRGRRASRRGRQAARVDLLPARQRHRPARRRGARRDPAQKEPVTPTREASRRHDHMQR